MKHKTLLLLFLLLSSRFAYADGGLVVLEYAFYFIAIVVGIGLASLLFAIIYFISGQKGASVVSTIFSILFLIMVFFLSTAIPFAMVLLVIPVFSFYLVGKRNQRKEEPVPVEELPPAFSLSKEFDVHHFQVQHIRLGSSVTELDYKMIVEIHIKDTEYKDQNFIQRLKLLREKDGWVHYAGGAAFGIRKGMINEIVLRDRFVSGIALTRKEIIHELGKPDIELKDDISYGADYGILHIILGYRSRQLYAFTDPETEMLKELHLGEFDEKIYSTYVY